MKTAWIILFFSCNPRTTEEVVSKKDVAKTPIFIDLDGQNWRFPISSLDSKNQPKKDSILGMANTTYLNGEYRKAIEQLLPYVKKKPQSAAAHALISACFFRLNDLQQAEKAANHAIEYDPSVVSYSNLGSILAGRGKTVAAIASYEKARALDPKHFLPIRNLVTLYYNQRDLINAENLLYELIKIDPLDSYGYVSLGQVLVEQNRWKDAEEVYRFRLMDLKTAPRSERRLAGGMMLDLPLALANVLLHQKRYQEAEKYFLQTITLCDTAQSTWTAANTYKLNAYVGLVKIYMAIDEKEKEAHFRSLYKSLRQ